jgi:short-subunit dehydrogenase
MEANNIALITGASSGIGATFARQLAAQGYDLILVARRRERLVALATELEERYAISAQSLVSDLSTADGVEQVASWIAELDSLDILVNNAGFGIVGKFAESDLARHLDMIHVHVIASVCLCRSALPGMIARHRGNIINVSSISAFIPVGNVTYTSTKAYLVAFSEALQVELSGTGVRVQALCPGFTYTEFHDTPELLDDFDRSQFPKWMWMSADEVVGGSLNALGRGSVVYVPGIRNRLLATVGRSRIVSLLLRVWLKMRGNTDGRD